MFMREIIRRIPDRHVAARPESPADSSGRQDAAAAARLVVV
jgi:hypothetical protein